MKKIIKLFLLILLFLLLAWPVYYFINKRNRNEVSFVLEKPLKKDIQNFIICSGIILPKEEVEIKSRVSGVLDEIYVKTGDSVYRDQIIAKIKIIADVGQLASSESKINLAKINFDNQQSQYNRNKILFDKGIISRSEFEIKETSFLNSKEELSRSYKEYKIIKSGDYSSNKQSNTSIVSTIDGIVTLLPTKIGSTIIQSNNFNDGTTIAKIANVSEMVFDGHVKEYEVGNLQLGMPVLINTSLSDQEEEGFLSEISTSGKNSDGIILFNIKSKLKMSKLKKTGFSANAKILTKEHKNVLCIKEDWLTFNNDSAFVYTHKSDDEFEKTYVKLGISDGIYSEVLSDPNEIETIRVYDK